MEIVEQQLTIPCTGQPDIPVSIWTACAEPSGIVLIGHGLGVDRYDVTVRRPMEVLTQEHAARVVVPEIPLHGERDPYPDDPAGMVDRWQAYWMSGGVEALARELLTLLAYCRDTYGTLPITYFGASLGTQYGVVFLAQTDLIRAAVLGLFGSYPAPLTPVMNRFAPEVRCPVYFIQKRDDEIHSAESTTHLYSTLGSTDKHLDSSVGGHTDVSLATLHDSCAFLAERGFRAPQRQARP